MRCVEGDGTEPLAPTAKRSPSVLLRSLLRDAAGVRAVPLCRLRPAGRVLRCRRAAAAPRTTSQVPVNRGMPPLPSVLPLIRSGRPARRACPATRSSSSRGSTVTAAARSRRQQGHGGSTVTKGEPAPGGIRSRAVPAPYGRARCGRTTRPVRRTGTHSRVDAGGPVRLWGRSRRGAAARALWFTEGAVRHRRPPAPVRVVISHRVRSSKIRDMGKRTVVRCRPVTG
jgi:hypothetical protein